MGAIQQAMAAHPLVTDDAYTQGTGNNQLEINSDRISERDGGKETAGDVTYSYGVVDNVDLMVDQPMTVSAPRGLGDASIALKWRFFDSDDTKLALKPVWTLGTANDEKGFGNGRSNLGLTFIATHEIGRWALHYNLGAATNRFASQAQQDENRRMLWATSAAATYALTPQLKAVGDIGVRRNDETDNRKNPAFALTGLIYSPTPDLDLDAGIRFGLNKAEIKNQIGFGITARF
ncbi:MAG: hypothetical protein JWP38_2426 [Herbaspirillum sp.]|jgi:hypothetical protein|nr:hypothetical protein [Herbaspirillum sp.]